MAVTNGATHCCSGGDCLGNADQIQVVGTLGLHRKQYIGAASVAPSRQPRYTLRPVVTTRSGHLVVKGTERLCYQDLRMHASFDQTRRHAG